METISDLENNIESVDNYSIVDSGVISARGKERDQSAKKKKKKKKKKKDNEISEAESESTPSVSARKNSSRRGKSGRTMIENKEADPRLWVRLANEKNEIYYYNVKTEDYAWLAPCHICNNASQKWCIECCKPFCDNDYIVAKNHTTNDDINKDANLSSSLSSKFNFATSTNRLLSPPRPNQSHTHTFQSFEPYFKESLSLPSPSPSDFNSVSQKKISSSSKGKSSRSKPVTLGPVFCLECQLREATKLCSECWDAYCAPCCE